MFQKIKTQDNQIGCIVEIFNNGEAYMIDILEDDGNYSQITIYAHQVKSVFVEVEKPVGSML